MDKYIVEIDGENIFLDASGTKLALSVKADNGYAVFCTEIPLTPYTEPDMEQVRKEAFEKGYSTAVAEQECAVRGAAEKGYQRGLSDAWECARKIIHMPEGDLLNIFTECYSAVCTALQVLLKYDASEAIEKIRQYEQPVTAEDVMRQYLDTFCKDRSCSGCPLNTPDFTCGRGYHFLTAEPVSDEEVRRAYAKVLQKGEVE